MDPCGTLAAILYSFDLTPLTDTINFLSLKKFEMILVVRYVGTLCLSNLKINPRCQTVSKAFSKSTKSIAVDLFLLEFKLI